MNFISQIVETGRKEVLTDVDTLFTRHGIDPAKQKEIRPELEKLLQDRNSAIEQTIGAELSAKERILVAELQQGDAYTKRARPTVVYAGLGFILLNYCIVPAIQAIAGAAVVKPFALPPEFWVAWGGIVATWSVGRSAEKRGSRSRAVSMITGSRLPTTSLLADPEK